ncbi:hypothetical protein N7532_010218 [Penicillium argentinense]|uniref:Uncharacterized protein n=1 Tax=Penicillium argentinense TaxID=1131581 RepID=A0A9W9EP88_9EURO|nr:uncharacterized protein N7532_010218 [Penicillium argentinense]KAJ5085447.1 hypothetical protein N7532_010218 [Penicillium argentinense]
MIVAEDGIAMVCWFIYNGINGIPLHPSLPTTIIQPPISQHRTNPTELSPTCPSPSHPPLNRIGRYPTKETEAPEKTNASKKTNAQFNVLELPCSGTYMEKLSKTSVQLPTLPPKFKRQFTLGPQLIQCHSQRTSKRALGIQDQANQSLGSLFGRLVRQSLMEGLSRYDTEELADDLDFLDTCVDLVTHELVDSWVGCLRITVLMAVGPTWEEDARDV